MLISEVRAVWTSADATTGGGRGATPRSPGRWHFDTWYRAGYVVPRFARRGHRAGSLAPSWAGRPSCDGRSCWGSAFHVMLALRCSSRQVVVADGWDPEGQSSWGALVPEKAVDTTAARSTPAAPPRRCAHHHADARVSSLESQCLSLPG